MFTSRFYSRLLMALLMTSVLVTTVMLYASPAKAYTVNGTRWPSSWNVPLQIDDMSLSKDYTGAYDGAMAWNNSPATMTFDIGNTSGASNLVEIYDDNNGANNTPGFTYPGTSGQYCPDGTSVLTYATIVMNTHYTSGYPLGKIQEVAAHEMGHALGLGHTNDQHTLMYFNVSNYDRYGINTPQQDEVNGITDIYYTSC